MMPFIVLLIKHSYCVTLFVAMALLLSSCYFIAEHVSQS
jgi:hypothetical protein